MQSKTEGNKDGIRVLGKGISKGTVNRIRNRNMKETGKVGTF